MPPAARRFPLAALLAFPLAAFLVQPEPGRSAPAPLFRLTREATNSLGMKLVLIPKGKFQMGSPQAGEGPAHEVEITRPFYMGAHEVTQAQLEKLLGKHENYFAQGGRGAGSVVGLNTSDFPAEHVAYDKAVEFCKKLSALPAEKAARRVYRLPTEAEWEYACRAGTATAYSFGDKLDNTTANFNSKLNRTTKVGSYRPNAWGLYDMHGNVFEWCADWYQENYYTISPRKDPQGPNAGTYRVLRGGCWSNPADMCRSSRRMQFTPSFGEAGGIGFRVACDVGGAR